MTKPFLLPLLVCLSFLSFSGYAQNAWQIEKKEFLFENPPFAECHASTLLEVSPGKILVAYFAGSDEGSKDVGIWLSEGVKGTWKKPRLLFEGIINDTLRYPCWNPVLFKPKGGKLTLYYKVGPSPREWWGMVSTSNDNGKTWGTAKRLPDGVLGPIKNKAIELADGTILSPSSTETRQSWKVHVERSTDKGKTWDIIPVDHSSAFQVIQPTFLTYPGNKIQMLCRSKSDRIVQAFSTDNGKTWGPMSTISLLNPNSGIDGVTLKNGWQLLVYNPTTRGKEWMNGRGELNVAISKDGENWKDIAVLETGDDKKEFSYPAVIEGKNGQVFITYTYDRKNVKFVVLQQGSK